MAHDRDVEADAESSSTDHSIPSAGELRRAGLLALLYLFDGKLEPDWNSDLQFSTVIVAMMTVFRLSLGGIIETCISQDAWIWVSAFRKGRTEARLEDFKMFDEASRGLWGALVLIWRMKARHLACIGAAITILIQASETFSSQMVQFNEYPTVYVDRVSMNALAAPPPPRAEAWHNIVPQGFGGDMSLGLSTKAAIYDGVIAGTLSDLPVSCATANCTWPIYPSLAVCGNCTESLHRTSCDVETGCNYTMPSGTSIFNPVGIPYEYHFTVAPSNGSAGYFDQSSRAFFSIFDLMSVTTTSKETRVEAYECALWVCLQSYNTTVTNGIKTSSVIAKWSKAEFVPESSAHFDEYVFQDIPPELNADNYTRYSVPSDSLEALRDFMNAIMWGNASEVAGVVDYSSDWVQAMQNATSDLPDWMNRLTLSLTNNVRLSGTFDTTKALYYSGTAYIMASHVDVNWYWVLYPMTLMVFGILCLVITVWRTAHDQVCAWKGDSLPMLFCRVSKGIHAQVRDGMDVPEGLNDRLGRTEVELIRKEDGQWFFREPRNH
ncbi:Uu.00g034070.m01.CDS01 [Anthostomella pinea]|uniref:Uu.00g034070.m01.CDS01 n=1 Tax=Anthostomella pinea TaxID=933095 RepID=A0AAI8V901_9PEZI|nr:Uu.00g034070.m01.CDS01 [Anthostomella pinea]